MSNVTGTLQSGTYIIKNVSSSNYATLTDANNGSNIVASSDADSDNVKWTITKLSSNKYTLMSYVWGTYGWIGGSPSSGDRVVSRADSYQWCIKETGTKGVYLIYPNSDDSLYWGLINSSKDTVIKLDTANDDKNKWNFVRVQV